MNLNEIIQPMAILLQPLLVLLCRRQFSKCCLSLDVYCVYMSACYKSSLCLSVRHALSFSWLSVTDANSV